MLKNLTGITLPQISWQKVKNKILGKAYDLSLVFVPEGEMAKISRSSSAHRGPANVLAFGLAKNTGEIFINLPQAMREAKSFQKKPKEHLLFLYIHALLHLRGLKHETKNQLKAMQKSEQKWLKILS